MTFAEKEKIRQDTIKYMEKTFDIEGVWDISVDDDGIVKLTAMNMKMTRKDKTPMINWEKLVKK